ncbi:MAG: 3-methyl-2-oxobutanoate hydroxymethyltransferase [Verrucomicrobia bacterium]|jgi:3-methyl-2-oxobutanoate hydroxymethyltransferase|nr:3-methyl-2-oxobutanoate hydroxymethyltransferase [Verrucomicrobiota bacterium]MBT7067104.1 3-methyl-2-oxobutanoate hydroxymethyltransferase [Verrucomicrobiota bacterium]MBT7699238.1 3-methyl-2-oxobutanoate hydroxymethyltransferase [Verrucomicrobiota bacterium]
MSISTVADLLATKGKRQLVLTTAFDAWTAKAAEESGIDMILAWGETLEHSKWVIDSVRQGAPNTLIGSGLPSIGAYSSEAEALRLAGELRAAGNDIVYCSGLVPEKFAALSRQHYPCCGHVGYLPVNDTWYGGPRAVGKTSEEALEVYEATMALEEAGCIAVEMEVVPAKVAARITEQTRMLVFSMGSGPDCDGQFIFSSDILGTHTGHYPRHSITYASLFKTAVDALSRYREDVLSGDYPRAAHTIDMTDQEYEKFSASLESRAQDG